MKFEIDPTDSRLTITPEDAEEVDTLESTFVEGRIHFQCYKKGGEWAQIEYLLISEDGETQALDEIVARQSEE